VLVRLKPDITSAMMRPLTTAPTRNTVSTAASSTISVLVADDEPLARKGLRVWLRTETHLTVVGEASTGPEAVRAIETLRPDLVFLDIRMPGLDGFQVLARAAPVHLPLVIFVTAYDSYALKAFETHAIDYLLKPLTERRLRQAIDRARWVLAAQEELEKKHGGLLQMLESRGSLQGQPTGDTGSASRYLSRFAVRDDNRYLLVTAEQVDWIDSAANYVRLHVGNSAYLIRMTMNELEQKLDPDRFARIHRSTIVNISRVKEVTPDWHGEFDVKLVDGTNLRLTRTYRQRLLP
jgi:two-component system LytT family response regulator